MSTPLPLLREAAVAPGRLEPISPLVRRIVAPNAGPFTYRGTGTYVVGRGRVAVIDPGPDLAAHVEALLAALAGETVTHILVTHTHADHSPAARAVQRRTGAAIVGCAPHGAGGEAVEEAADLDYAPDEEMREGDAVAGPGWTLAAVATPGHTSNHLCFALAEEATLFSGDHVMGWSTTVVAPPDGDMGAYRASLDKLLGRADALYRPTHGPAIADPERHVRAYIAHRAEREAAILARLAAGDERVEAIVRAVYVGLDPRLLAAAGRSVLAHLEELARRGRVETDGGRYRLASTTKRR
jgi:glyoxylase-like metal-dependent hydrolase (beta-lactamase superfamily II)